MVVNTSISYPEEYKEWVQTNIPSLSKYLQEHIKIDMNKQKNQQQYQINNKKQNIGISLMFMIIGMGFAMIGILFLYSPNTAYLLPSIFFLVIGIISIIFGTMGLGEIFIKNLDEKTIIKTDGG